MSKNITITWDLPTTRQSGGPLSPQDIDHIQVELSADGGANYGEIARLAPTDEQKVFVPDSEPGIWHFRISVVDITGGRGVHIEQVEVPVPVDNTPPNPVSNVNVTLD